ncbi:putative membrane protein [Staphylococcus auricularis]|uniref:DUF1440 domain-containing protein n=1 Tax=Staphylococcus auricularis TaxID=29379 RepID=A0ABX5IGG4_9STAP|nr:DUF1440 domain-containing protein [Staphylococcus auricularis]MBM0868266.1 DUF1440 domain-containing protein [Staphylococcus auricularis]MCG7340720.1 DUF1440 domain-containing protein [Staphylococcus auricularis]PTH18477.1 DUF1440 domain-containing protein [Staphylococcus auricularis]
MNKTTKRIIVTGLFGGFLGGAVKMGWESLVPPRTPERDEEPPPLTMLKKFGVPEDIQNLTVTYNNNEIPVTTMGVHYGFSIANAFAYALLAEKSSAVTKLRGSLFGIAIHVIFHEFVLPKLKLTPPVEQMPPEERLSELLGHVLWMNAIDYVHDANK